MKISIDAATGGVLMAKPISEADQLLEDIASNNYHWVSERGLPKQGGRHEVDAFTMLASKVDALFKKIDQLQPTLSHGGIPNRSTRQTCVWEVRGTHGYSGMSVILATPFKISSLNKPMASITSIIDHKMTPTPMPSIRVGDNTPTSPTKI